MPVLIVAVPPLLDYPNHLARMHILAAWPSPALAEFYDMGWRPVPNLAMDLVVPPLAQVMPLAWAAKLFLLLTFLLLAGGTAALHRALFRRWSAWPLLAFFLLYNRSLIWGFENFLFAAGLAMVSLACWVALRDRALLLRLGVATLISLALYFAHLFAFGAYALALFGYELAWLRERRSPLRGALATLATATLPFVVPAAIFLAASHGGGASHLVVYGRLVRKLDLLFTIVDNYVRWFDIASLVALVALFVACGVTRRLRVHPLMALPLGVLAAAQLAMPTQIFGASGVDHRMMLILALILVGASDVVGAVRGWQRAIAGGLALLFVVRVGIVGEVWLAQDRAVAPMVEALMSLPKGAKLAVAYGPGIVHSPRTAAPVLHLACLAVIGADAFVPTLFADPGQQPLRLQPPYAELATAVGADDYWSVLVDGNPDEHGRVAAALKRYDFILFAGTAEAPLHPGPGLVPRAAIPGAQLFAIPRSG